MALDCHRRVATEAVQGDIGWSSFEAREACSKIAFEARLRHLSDSRWTRCIFWYLYLKSIRTQWSNRVHRLRGKFGFFGETDSGLPEGLTPCSVRTQVREIESAQWRSGVLRKSTLRMCRKHKA